MTRWSTSVLTTGHAEIRVTLNFVHLTLSRCGLRCLRWGMNAIRRDGGRRAQASTFRFGLLSRNCAARPSGPPIRTLAGIRPTLVRTGSALKGLAREDDVNVGGYI